MSPLPRSPRPAGLAWGALALAALVGGSLAAAAPPTGTAAQGGTPLLLPGQAHTEIRLPAPVRYALLSQAPGPVRLLVARGEVLFHPADATRTWTVERIEADTLIVREGPRGQRQVVPTGRPIPGFPGLTFTGTVLLQELHYRYKVVDRLTHPDPVLVALDGLRAVLEVEVLPAAAPGGADPVEAAARPASEPPAPPRATLDGALLEKVRVRETSPGRYEVPAADVQAMLENAGRVLADLAPLVLPTLSLQRGLEYRITSAAGDGLLTNQGFTLTAPKLAERAGLQVGDTILRVNGKPVDGFASLYGIFQAVRRDPALQTVQVELDRRGTRLTKTYRIR